MLGHEHEAPRRPHFDIHGGGLDLVFPHHENEVVQSESYTGKPFATYWLHNGLLTKDGKKISKSDPGTIVLMSDLLKAHDPDTLRAPVPDQPLPPADRLRPVAARRDRRGAPGLPQGLRALRAADRRGLLHARAPRSPRRLRPGRVGAAPGEIAEHRQRFLDAMDDDFNTGGALGELFDLVHALNRFADAPELDAGRDPGAGRVPRGRWSSSRS